MPRVDRLSQRTLLGGSQSQFAEPIVGELLHVHLPDRYGLDMKTHFQKQKDCTVEEHPSDSN